MLDEKKRWVLDEKMRRGLAPGIKILNDISNSFFDIQIEKSEWLDSKEAAKYLKITTNALRILVHRRLIQRYKFRRRLRFKLEDCRTLINKGVLR